MSGDDRQKRRLLLATFGGLLLLLAAIGLYAVSVLKTIELRNESIRKDYVNRERILEELRSDIYLSGTYARDLLLEEDAKRANVHRRELQDARKRIEANIAVYNIVLRGEETSAFHEFTKEVDSYFNSLKPALEWNTSERKAFGYKFMEGSLLPRRMTIVHLADQIGVMNQRQLESGNQQIIALFSDFRRSLIVLLVLTLVSGAFLAAGSLRRILRLEHISAARFEEVEHARAVLSDLSARFIAVQESERRSLSRELHDEVGQSLSAVLLGIGNLAAVLSPDNIQARAQLSDLRKLTERTVATVRDMSLLLRPSMLDDLGLIPAVEWQAREISRVDNIAVQVHSHSIPEELPDEYKTCIYRIVQEALRNCVRHAKAKSVQIHLSQSDGHLNLTIQDDGQGFTPEREKGLGLLGMEERVTHLHGSFRIESTIGAGTSIRVELPFSPKSAVVAI